MDFFYTVLQQGNYFCKNFLDLYSSRWRILNSKGFALIVCQSVYIELSKGETTQQASYF
jgi:hypothetical protein